MTDLSSDNQHIYLISKSISDPWKIFDDNKIDLSFDYLWSISMSFILHSGEIVENI